MSSASTAPVGLPPALPSAALPADAHPSASSPSVPALSIGAPTSAAPSPPRVHPVLPLLPSNPLPYAELLSRYQSACHDRDALAAQVEKLTTTASAASSSTSSSLSVSLSPPSPSSLSRLHPTSALSPHRPPSSSSSTPSSTHPTASAPPATLQSLREQHAVIQSTISTIQHRTARILHDQERELIRAFRTRLSEVTAELQAERARSESGSAEWVTRCKKLSEELEWLKGLTEQLTTENRDMAKEARRMRRQMKVHEEDREFLIQQLVSAKKEGARLRQMLDKHTGAGQGAGAGGAGGAHSSASSKEQQQQWLSLGKEEKVAMG